MDNIKYYQLVNERMWPGMVNVMAEKR